MHTQEEEAAEGQQNSSKSFPDINHPETGSIGGKSSMGSVFNSIQSQRVDVSTGEGGNLEA